MPSILWEENWMAQDYIRHIEEKATTCRTPNSTVVADSELQLVVDDIFSLAYSNIGL